MFPIYHHFQQSCQNNSLMVLAVTLDFETQSRIVEVQLMFSFLKYFSKADTTITLILQ